MSRQRSVVHLDTHVVCWLYAGLTHQLSDSAKSLIEQNELHVSPFVLSELQTLFERGILTLSAQDIFDDLERRIGLRIASGEMAALVKASYALSWATDPYDRGIVAHARLNEAPLLSKDAHLHAHFPQVVW